MYKSMLLPVDLNQESSCKSALPTAIHMAQSLSIKMHIITVIPDFGMAVVGSFFPADYEEKATQATQEALDTFVSENLPADLVASASISHGVIYKEIMVAADDKGCDLIVLSSHRPETKDYLLGPNAARVARHATQSVFVVRDQDS